ncbi:MAG TPA: PBP1A family penicillin-binding protein [Vicinamibacterales bacterium]
MRGRVLVGTIGLVVVAFWVATAIVLRASWGVVEEIAHAATLAEIGPHPQSTIVYDRHDRPVFSFYFEQREDVPLERISPRMIDALLAVEDRRFYSHHGLDGVRILKAAWRNWRAGRILEGGSTLTQQLARLEQLTPRRTFERKVREAAIAVRLEERYSKAEILSAYLNAVYFGEGYYGVEAAARGYFGKPAAALEPHEAALLAALVRSPILYSPSAAPERALARRNLVLRVMRDTGRLTAADYAHARGMPLLPPAIGRAADHDRDCGRYYEEEVRRELIARFGGKQVLRGGLHVYTGYDQEMQCAADASIDARVAQVARAQKSARDLEASLVAIDPASGEVRALVGGRDSGSTGYNRATQARRQPGSAFKPIVYAAALEHGMAPASVLRDLDEPIMTADGPWLPAGEHEAGDYSLRDALRLSSNRAAAQLLQRVGISQATYYAQRLGIESPMPAVPSLALGTGSVTLLELTSAYAAFANSGVAIAPHLITRVEDAAGTPLWTDVPMRRQAVTPATAFLMSSMLADVIDSGTATSARAAGFKLPAAGKTGTTDDYTDGWFVGYTPHLVAGVWFGLDKPAPIMARGFAAVVAVPAWAAFMKRATVHDRPDAFQPPPDVEKATVCRLTGMLATDACRHGWTGVNYVQAGVVDLPGEPIGASGRSAGAPPKTRASVYDDYFPIGSVPTAPCPIHGSASVPDAAGSFGAPQSDAAGTIPGSYQSSASSVERLVGADGRVTWVIRHP